VNSAPSNHCAESIQYEGARNALWHIVYTLSDNLLHVIPTCTEYFLKPLLLPEAQSTPQLLINSLQVCTSTVQYADLKVFILFTIRISLLSMVFIINGFGTVF